MPNNSSKISIFKFTKFIVIKENIIKNFVPKSSLEKNEEIKYININNDIFFKKILTKKYIVII